MSDGAVKFRYERANVRVIAVCDALVFASLMDIPRLLKEREALLAKVKELTKDVQAV
jgi:hypothetical protein